MALVLVPAASSVLVLPIVPNNRESMSKERGEARGARLVAQVRSHLLHSWWSRVVALDQLTRKRHLRRGQQRLAASRAQLGKTLGGVEGGCACEGVQDGAQNASGRNDSNLLSLRREGGGSKSGRISDRWFFQLFF